jgi:DNA-binding transcriptional LysR family regulator
MENIPIHLLQALTVFFEEQTLEKTAQRLHITQPAVSIQLKQLEQYFKHSVFQPQGRRKVLTTFGESLAQQLQVSLQSVQNSLLQAERQFSDEAQIRLKIGGRNEFLQVLVPPGLFPGMLEYQELSSQQVIQALQEGQIDMGVTHLRADLINYTSKKLRSDEICLIVPKVWNYKGSAKDFFKKHSDLPTLSYPSYLPIMEVLKKTYQIEQLNVKATMSDWNVVQKWVHEGLGWAAIPKLFAQSGANYQIFSLPDVPHGFEYYLYVRRDLRTFPWCRDLVDRIKSNIEA